MSFQSTVYGKYFLLERIAVGGMAEVFKAKTFGVHGFERLLVIKRILPHLSKDEEFVEMFIDEAKIAVELTHANICQVSDLGRIGDNYFIAMEYIDGKDLRAILKKCFSVKRTVTIPMAIHVATDILKGLDYAHRKNVIHRDISPQNIMVSYHGEVKIVDFGIAKTESKLNRTQAGVLKGKFGYMSPEQAAGLELDLRTDIFSAGIILYEMLTGRRLFLGENDFETLEKIKECSVPPPSKYNREIPPELESIMMRALAKEKEDRFHDSTELQVALSRVLYSKYPHAAPKDLGDFLQNLFAEEIAQERESLQRAMDALPPDQVAAATSAVESASDRLVQSSVSSPSRKGSEVLVSANRARSRSIGPKKKISPLLAVLIVAGTAALVAIAGWKFLNPAPPPPLVKPRPTPPAVMVDIEIKTSPKAAQASVDGVAVGVTPLTLKLTPKKVYRLQLAKTGYKPFDQQFLVTEDQRSYSFDMEKDLPTLGLLHVFSDPPGAVIKFDQDDTGLKTPATLENVKLNVSHKIRLEMPGFRPVTQSIVLKSAEDEFRAQLEKNIAQLRIKVTPEDATILIDGQERGNDPELEPGKSHKLVVRRDGYETVERTIKPAARLEEIVIALKKRETIFGTISLAGRPWASILIDGKTVSDGGPLADYALPVGKHTVIFRHPDFKDITKNITIKAGANPPIIIDFKSP